MLVVFYYYRFKVSLDDVVELMELRGFNICHQTVHNWVHTFGVELGLKLREARRGKDGKYKNNCLEQDHRGPKSQAICDEGFKKYILCIAVLYSLR